MSIVKERDRERARKIYALYERGSTDGERKAAYARLADMSRRIGVSISELVDDRVAYRTNHNKPKNNYWSKMRRELRPDYEEFMQEYRESQNEFGLGRWVPARLLAMTGLILYDLDRFGYIERNGDSFAPVH